MSRRVRVRGRPSPDARCAFCHDDLVGAIDSCPRCQVAFHRDCGAHLAKCPTLGCEHDLRSVERAEDAPLLAAGWGLVTTLAFERFVWIALLLLAPVGIVAMLLDVDFAHAFHEEPAGTIALALIPIAAFASAAVALGRDVSFFRAVKRLCSSELAMRVVGTLRIEVTRDDEGERSRVQVLDLRDPNTGALRFTLDLDPPLGSPPDWVTTLRAGQPLRVYARSGSGPVVIEHPATGELYAVPERRVERPRTS